MRRILFIHDVTKRREPERELEDEP